MSLLLLFDQSFQLSIVVVERFHDSFLFTRARLGEFVLESKEFLLHVALLVVDLFRTHLGEIRRPSMSKTMSRHPFLDLSSFDFQLRRRMARGRVRRERTRGCQRTFGRRRWIGRRERRVGTIRCDQRSFRRRPTSIGQTTIRRRRR